MIVGASMVRNEGDIIEAFIRHNLRFVDKMTIFVHHSTDCTPTILKSLVGEGLSIEIRNDFRMGQFQSENMTAVMQECLELEDVDFFVPLDADEFIVCDNKENFVAKMRSAFPHAPLLPWRTYVPLPSDDWSEPHPVRRIQYRRLTEPEVIYKVAVPRSMFKGHVISSGNHRLLKPSGSVASHAVIDVPIGHFPIRSEEQFLAKIFLGAWATQLTTGLHPGTNSHWTNLARLLSDKPSLTKEELARYAANYPSRSHQDDVGLVHDPIVLFRSNNLRYSNLALSSAVASIIRFTNSAVGELAQRTIEPS